MEQQLSIFSLYDRQPLEQWVFDDLRDWAMTVYPGWKTIEWSDGEKSLRIERSRCEMTLSLGHFSDSYKDGIACVHFNRLDMRNGCSGFGYASEDVSKIEKSILETVDMYWG